VTSVSFPRYVQRREAEVLEPATRENRKTRRKNKREERMMQGEAALDGVMIEREGPDEVEHMEQQDEQVVSDVVAPASVSPRKRSAAEIGGSIEDWTDADNRWESLDRVKWTDVVAGEGEAMVGSVLAWKVRASGVAASRPIGSLRMPRPLSQELEMNLETFTPELMLKLGRLISTGYDQSEEDGPPRITLRVLTKPAAHDEYDEGGDQWNDDEREGDGEEYRMSKAEIRRLAFSVAMEETHDGEETIDLGEVELGSGDYRLVATASR
jgi:hypothetical protein